MKHNPVFCYSIFLPKTNIFSMIIKIWKILLAFEIEQNTLFLLRTKSHLAVETARKIRRWGDLSSSVLGDKWESEIYSKHPPVSKSIAREVKGGASLQATICPRSSSACVAQLFSHSGLALSRLFVYSSAE